ncbi:MAG: ferrochelatase [Acidimicrobiia bacterium]|nr:ferrochelatase [Acidimicrobiia bacterium]
MNDEYDAIVLISFGGPEGPDDVLPFLRNVTAGRGIPDERLREVSAHYDRFGGVSPINQQCRDLIAALELELRGVGIDLPIHWGNRNWHPMLADTVAAMRDDGVTNALGIVTSAFSSYSSCRQYQEDIAAARAVVGQGAPTIDKVRPYWDHPGFLAAVTDRTDSAIAALDDRERRAARLVFTAHSIPMSMAATSDYVAQLEEAAHIISTRLPTIAGYDLAYQSRSGAPHVPWLEPDIVEHLGTLDPATIAVVVPLGFVSDHMEVLFDLDLEAANAAEERGIRFIRVPTVGTHPRFVRALRELIEERLDDRPRLSCAADGPRPDVCAADCCPAPIRPASPTN